MVLFWLMRLADFRAEFDVRASSVIAFTCESETRKNYISAPPLLINSDERVCHFH